MANRITTARGGGPEPYLKPEPVEYAADGMPILYEDESEGEMGEVSWHGDDIRILYIGLGAHLKGRPVLRVFSNMNLYYRKRPLHKRTKSKPYVSPDIMVVEPDPPLSAQQAVESYEIGVDGPAPLLTIEVLSRRSAQQRDKTAKAEVYRRLRIPEYILVDTTGRFLKEHLQLWRLRVDGSWSKEQDADGGVTSQMGFRIMLEGDGQLRLFNTNTGKAYARPEEAQGMADKVATLEAELARLRGNASKQTKGKGRRPQS